MAGRFLDQKPRVGKRWPYRALDFLPPGPLWRFLAWRSGGDRPEAPFDVAKSLSGGGRILLLLPEDTRELLVALPVVQSLFRAQPQAAIWLLAGPKESGFLAGLFGQERLLVVDPDRFLFGEEHFRETLQRLEAMRTEVAVNFRSNAPPLIQFLFRSTGAPVRIQLGTGPGMPWANITLAAGEPPNHLRRFQMAARLWDSAGVPLSGKWGRIVPPPEASSRARKVLSSASLDPAGTVLVPWQDGDAQAQADLVAALSTREGRAPTRRTVALLQAKDPLFASPPVPPALASSHPVLRADAASTVLALFASTAATMGMNGSLLLLAGLTDADVTGYFKDEDAPWDTSAGNAKLRVERLEDLRA